MEVKMGKQKRVRPHNREGDGRVRGHLRIKRTNYKKRK